MFNPSRDQVRQFFFDTWSKFRSGRPLAGLEQTALEVILLHPEYHSTIEDSGRNAARDYAPEDGMMNPFLHLSLHLAIEEQLSIDQPPGIAAEFNRISARHGERHRALHEVLDCLGETVWRAQRLGAPPDTQAYLECLKKLTRRSGAG